MNLRKRIKDLWMNNSWATKRNIGGITIEFLDIKEELDGISEKMEEQHVGMKKSLESKIIATSNVFEWKTNDMLTAMELLKKENAAALEYMKETLKVEAGKLSGQDQAFVQRMKTVFGNSGQKSSIVAVEQTILGMKKEMDELRSKLAKTRKKLESLDEDYKALAKDNMKCRCENKELNDKLDELLAGSNDVSEEKTQQEPDNGSEEVQHKNYEIPAEE